MNYLNSSTKPARRLKRQRKSSRQLPGHRCRRQGALWEVLEDRRLLTTDFGQIAAALNGQLLGVQTQLTSTLNNYRSGSDSSLPLVGHLLGNASQIVTRFSTDLRNALSGLGSINNPSDSDIQNALASVPFLSDRNGNGVGADDVLVTHPSGFGSSGFEVDMRLQAAAPAASTTINFDTGLPALPLKLMTSGTVDVSVGFAYELAFTYNSDNQQVAIDSSKKLDGLTAPDGNHAIIDPLHPLAIFISAGLHEGFSARATLGFAEGTVTGIADQPNALYLTAMVDNLGGAADVEA